MTEKYFGTFEKWPLNRGWPLKRGLLYSVSTVARNLVKSGNGVKSLNKDSPIIHFIVKLHIARQCDLLQGNAL